MGEFEIIDQVKSNEIKLSYQLSAFSCQMGYADMQVFRYTDIQKYRYTEIQIYRCTDIQMYRYTDVQLG